jgi:hypothetical protein
LDFDDHPVGEDDRINPGERWSLRGPLLFLKHPSLSTDADDNVADLFWQVMEDEQGDPEDDGAECNTRPHRPPIIAWGSDDSAFNLVNQRNLPYQSIGDFHSAISEAHLPSTVPPEPAAALPSALERGPILRPYQLAYNTVNDILICENPGKVGGMCCAALPINQVFKHLTQKAVRETSDCIVHGYPLKPAEKAPLEQLLRENYPKAPFTPAEMQQIIPHPDQIGPVVGVRPPVPGYICSLCHRGYTSKDAARAHWKQKHKTVNRNPGVPPLATKFEDRFFWVPQMQSLSLHANMIRYFAIRPDGAGSHSDHPAASSDDMTALNSLQDEVFGPDDEIDVDEIDVNAVQAFFKTSGAVDHVAGLSADKLIPLVGLPRQDEPPLVKLRRAQSLRFTMYCKRVSTGSIALRRLIVITKPFVILSGSKVDNYLRSPFYATGDKQPTRSSIRRRCLLPE